MRPTYLKVYMLTKKFLSTIILGLLLSSNSYAGIGDKTIVLGCISAAEPHTYLKFKILKHPEKGTRIKSYKVSNVDPKASPKFWDDELLASSKINTAGKEFITWIKYFAISKPSIWAFGVSPVGSSPQLNVIYYTNISAFESNLRDLRDKALGTKYDRKNQNKTNDKHWEYVLAKEKVFNKIFNSNKKGEKVAFVCDPKY